MSQHILHQITSRCFWFSPDSTTDRPVLGGIVGERGTLLVDAGNSAAHVQQLREALEQRKLPAPDWLMLTHWHWDHIFGAASLPIPAIAHRETRRVMQVMAQLPWDDLALDARVAAGTEIAFCRDMIKAELPDRSELCIRVPELAFDTQLDLDLGDVICQMIHVGGDHAHDSSIVYVPTERLVFLGDCYYEDLYHGPRRLTLEGILPLLDRLEALDADHYLPAHHSEPLSRAEFLSEAAQIRQIGQLVARYGDDRDALLAAVPERFGRPLTEDDQELIDAFLAGLRLPHAAPVM